MKHTKSYRLALIGFGATGRGLTQILRDGANWLHTRHGLDVRIVGVCTRSRGCVYDPNGIAPATLLEAFEQHGDLRRLPGAVDWDAAGFAANAEADILVELSPTDLQTGEPAASYIRTALQRGRHVVTANKGPVALHYAELAQLARDNNVQFGIEGTVMAGTPALRLGWSDLAAGPISEVRGIVNGTTNYILTQMESGQSYAEALAEAQRLGYAEADPAGDVEGFDAAGKAAILANVLMNGTLRPGDVERTGITGITPAMVAEAAAAGRRWKLIARAWRDGEQVRASVQPTALPVSHPLAGVSG
ncbi:MAG TPA: homoserine dehydrogenase, partial [Roseiflexaceae bacterium]|nr:homoserine dehydrogenase [Roseiflexaceae bacterium]